MTFTGLILGKSRDIKLKEEKCGIRKGQEFFYKIQELRGLLNEESDGSEESDSSKECD